MQESRQLHLKTAIRGRVSARELAAEIGMSCNRFRDCLNLTRRGDSAGVRRFADTRKRAIEKALRARGIPTKGIWNEEEFVSTNARGQYTLLRHLMEMGDLKYSTVRRLADVSKSTVSDLGMGRAHKYSKEIIRRVLAAVTTLGFDGAKCLWPYEQYLVGRRAGIFSAKEQKMLSQTVRTHFKLFNDPFINEFRSGKDDVYLSRSQKKAAKIIRDSIMNGGFLAVVGHVGSGKSTCWKYVEQTLDPKRYIVAVVRQISKERLSASAICEALLVHLGCDKIPGSLEARARVIGRRLEEHYLAGRRIVLVIDEAHELHHSTLRSLKRFWEYEKGFRKLLSILIVGHPHLKRRFESPDLEEVSLRCSLFEIQPLGKELREYVHWKLKRAGGANAQNPQRVITDDALELLAKRFRRARKKYGRPLDFPLFVNRCLSLAMEKACDLGEPRVTADIIGLLPINEDPEENSNEI